MPPSDIIMAESQIPSQSKAVIFFFFLTNRIRMAQWVKLQIVSALSLRIVTEKYEKLIMSYKGNFRLYYLTFSNKM